MLHAILAGLRAAGARLLLALVFGGIAFLLAQAVVGDVVERMGSAPEITPVPSAPSPQQVAATSA